MAAEAAAGGFDLLHAVALLGAGVVAVPLFRRLGLGSVLGYLAAGILIGPAGIRLFTDPGSILGVAELGVVMLLFVIGLELKPSRLWALRRDIFGLGIAQVVLTVTVLGGVALVFGVAFSTALIAAMGLSLSSTAIVLQMLDERGETSAPHGQKIFSVLLLQDLAIVPFLAVESLVSPVPEADDGISPPLKIAIALAAVAGLIAIGRYLLNPIFAAIAASKAREVLTAAALLVVLGAALAMEMSGLSMAMGAFLAGVLLSESSYRHELEADIEPFRGLLLGLFFLGVGMSLDVSLILRDWWLVLLVVVAFMVLKSAAIYAVARVRSGHAEAVRIALYLAQGGEFAFVLYAAAGTAGIFSAETAALLTASVIVSMALTPLVPFLLRLVLKPETDSMDGIDVPENLSGTALVIGWGRFGQVASQALLARGTDVSIIDDDTEMIRAAAQFGFKIYYGDGTRLDVLRAAGAGTAKIIAVCVDKRESTDRIVELIKSEFPLARLLVRSYDRGHTIDLINAGVDYQIRETYESALLFGEAALRELGAEAEEVARVMEDVRRRDEERLELQLAEGIFAGRDLMRGARPVPTPLSPPKRPAKTINEQEAAAAAAAEDEREAEKERTG
jgi:glutathione-regulated potassium-efflux system protein KefB